VKLIIFGITDNKYKSPAIFAAEKTPIPVMSNISKLIENMYIKNVMF
jgi:hypothetical protein